jgi:metal-responsive CopG/Arc/MetJ family transcriptional regulator
MKMKVLPISLPEQMMNKINKDSENQGISKAELIRRIIYLYYKDLSYEKKCNK